MSAPDTNIETQEQKHAPSLIGIKGAMAFGALMMIGLVFYAAFRADNYGASAYDEGASGTQAETSAIVEEVTDGQAATGAAASD